MSPRAQVEFDDIPGPAIRQQKRVRIQTRDAIEQRDVREIECECSAWRRVGHIDGPDLAGVGDGGVGGGEVRDCDGEVRGGEGCDAQDGVAGGEGGEEGGCGG